MIKQTIERFKNEKSLPAKTADGLKICNPKKLKFYITTKIHKPNKPVIPVRNLIECHTSKFCNSLITISRPWKNKFFHI